MNGEQARSYFLSLPESLEDFPFGPDTPVFKIKKKMFGFFFVEEYFLNSSGFFELEIDLPPNE